MASRTTGQTISRLGVLTCLAYNALPENHLPKDKRKKVIAEIREIMDGDAGVPAEKVIERSAERCIVGGHAFGFGAWTGGLN